jgi:hypothetical protein
MSREPGEALLQQLRMATSNYYVDGVDVCERARKRIAEARDIMAELDRTFEGIDADGAPSGDGSYWLGHSTALRVWYWLHPGRVPKATEPGF